MRLRLWRMDRLAVELRNQEVSEASKFLYLIVTVLLGLLLGGGGLMQLRSQPNGLVVFGLVTAVYVTGLFWAFRRNQAGDGVYFIERYICLSVPAYVRMLLLLYGTYFMVSIVAHDWVLANNTPLSFGLMISSLAAFYWWVARAISTAAGAQE